MDSYPLEYFLFMWQRIWRKQMAQNHVFVLCPFQPAIEVIVKSSLTIARWNKLLKLKGSSHIKGWKPMLSVPSHIRRSEHWATTSVAPNKKPIPWSFAFHRHRENNWNHEGETNSSIILGKKKLINGFVLDKASVTAALCPSYPCHGKHPAHGDSSSYPVALGFRFMQSQARAV